MYNKNNCPLIDTQHIYKFKKKKIISNIVGGLNQGRSQDLELGEVKA